MVKLRPHITPIRLHLISGALKRQKGAFSGAGKRQNVREILYRKKSGRVPNRIPKPNSGKVNSIEETTEETVVDEGEDQEPFLDSEIPGEEDQ